MAKRSYIKQFIHLEAASGIVLLAATFAALGIENSPLREWLAHFLHYPLAFEQSVHFWINDGLMAIFFLLIGLEIKRERIEGHLVSRQQFLLPAIAACGGVLLPALFFSLLNQGDSIALRGWAIPTATDIAFALCVMQLLGTRIPQGLKVTLVTIAIIDDLIAVLIIAIFYSEHIMLPALASAAAITGILAVLNHQKVTRLAPYLIAGAALWFCVLQSGIHATLAGIVVALFIPLRVAPHQISPARELESQLHPWVAFGIMPLFAFANAGVSLAGFSPKMLTENSITLGILVGLLVGKPLGVLLASVLSIRLGICRLPHQTQWTHYTAMAILCGIGFTMSLFIGGLSYSVAAQHHAVRVGVLTGSLFASVIGYVLLWLLCRSKTQNVP
jgi:NhaA family Na+:H+ antiporter